MTSTNDGKEVKSNLTSGAKVKTFYIELYRSLEAGLSKDSDLPERTRNLCEAWRRVHSLCAHSAASTHPHLLSWLQRHTARTVLQTEWQQPENKNEHKRLEEAINDFIKQSHSSSGGEPAWQTQLVARGEWFKRILANPWGHPVLRVLLDSTRKQSPKDEEILEWLKEERGVMFVTRLRQLASSKDCKDLALELASGILNRVRAGLDPPRDDQPDDPKDKPTDNSDPSFEDILKSEAGFTNEVMDLLTDIEFVLLHKRDLHARCIELAKLISLRNGYLAVERLQSRLESSPREKKLWKNAKDVATLIAQVVITRCMVVPLCAGASCVALRRSARALSTLVPRSRLPVVAAALAAPAATARHLHTLAVAVETERKDDMKPFVCELYVRAITAGMNELERLKLKSDKEPEARTYEKTLSQWFVQLGALLSASERMRCECNLTAFSVHPSPCMYARIQAAPALPPVALDIEPKSEQATSEFGSWASDSRSQTNFVKTSETLNLKQTQHQTNVLSTAILSEGEALELSPDLCQDITVLLSGPRVKTLSWDMDRELLLENCRAYMERTKFGTQAVTTELKYLNLDPRQYQHLPEEDEDDSDMYYGIEKGYEHLVEFQEPEEIWQDANDPERTESAHTTDIEIEEALLKSKSRKKPKKMISSEEDEDPLSSVAEAKRIEKKKERPHSKERSKERKPKTKTKLKEKDPLALEDVSTEIKPENQSTEIKSDQSVERKKDSTEKKKEGGAKKKEGGAKKKEGSAKKKEGGGKKKDSSNKQKDHSTEIKKEPKDKEKKEKKERKRKEKTVQSQSQSSSLSSLIGMKVTKLGDKKPATSTTTDSDYDNQGNVIFDGLFSMDELKSPEKVPDKNDKMGTMRNNDIHMTNGAVRVVAPEKGLETTRVPTPINRTEPKPKPIPDDVKNSITRLLQFRRNQKLSNKNKSLSQEHLADQPKTYMKKPHLEQQPELRNDMISSYLKECSPRPVIQYNQSPKPILFNNTPPTGVKILNAALQSPSPKPSTSREVKANQKTIEMLNRQNPTQAELQLQKQESKIFHDFLKDLQASINAGAGGKGASTPKKDIKPVNRINPVVPKSEPKVSPSAKQTVKKPEVAPNTFSRLSYYKNRNENKTKQIVEAIIDHQSKQLEMQPNVPDLDQLLAEHRNAKVKYLQASDTVIKPSRSSDNIQKVIKKTSGGSRELPLMSSLLQGSPNLAKTQVVHNDRPWDMSTPQSSRLSSSTEKEQQDLMLLLRQQSKQNLMRSKPETPKDKISLPPTNTSNLMPAHQSNIPSSKKINILDCKSVIINPPLSKLTSTKSDEVKSTALNPSLSKLTTIKSDEVRSTAKPKARNELHTKNVEKINTSVSKIVKNVIDPETRSVKTKTNTKHVDPTKHTDWESVMDALLKHKTPSRGPNALDIALNKDSSYMSVFENSLRNQRIVRPPSSSSETIEPTKKDSPTIRAPTIIDNMHNPNILRRSNTDSKDTKHKVTKQISKVKKVLSNPALEVRSSSSSLLRPQLPDSIPVLATEKKKITADSRPKTTVPKKVHTEPRKQQFTCPLPKEDDPFISGNLNSDYDLLEDLIDDELRKEIGESLLSDEDNYSSIHGLKDQKTFVCVNKTITTVIQPNKQTLPPPQIEAGLTRSIVKKPCNNAPKPTPNPTIPVQQTTEYVNVNTVTNTQYAKVQTVPAIQTTNIIHQIPKSVIVPSLTEQTYVSTVTSNQTYVAVPQPTALQNVVLIGSELVYQPCVQAPIHAGVAQNTYVTFNSQPNIAVYQTTQFAAPVVNPLIIGNAITTSSAPVAVPTQNVVASTVAKAAETVLPVVKEPPKSEVPKPVNEAKIELKNSMDIASHDEITVKEKCDINSSKNCERKVLSEVQEKLIEKIDSKAIKNRRLSFEHDVKKAADQERLKKKRMAILNRNIYHRSDNKPIPLTYSPLKNNKTETNKIQENQHNLSNTVKITDKLNDTSIKLESLINTKVKTINPEQVKVNEKDANENCKENKNEAEPCRRILLRSSNKLNSASAEKVVTVKAAPRKSKVRLKVDSELAKPEEIKSVIKKTKPVKRPKKTLNKTIKKVVIKKRITRQTTKNNAKVKSELEGKPKKEEKVAIGIEDKSAIVGKNNVPSVATDKTANVEKKAIFADSIPELMDIEDQILGSMILKTVTTETSLTDVLTLTDVADILSELEEKENSVDVTTDAYDNSFDRSSPVSNMSSPQPIQDEIDASKSNDENVNIEENIDKTNLEVISDKASQLTEKNTDIQDSKITEVEHVEEPQNAQKEVIETNELAEPIITDNVNEAPETVNEVSTENIDKPVEKTEEGKSTITESKTTQDEKKKQDEADVICLDNYDDAKSQNDIATTGPFGVDNMENIPKAFLDAITVEDLPTNDPKDPLKKCVRIKLPNGRAFKATVRGLNNINVETLFADPGLKSVLLSNVSNKNRYTLNIKQVSTSNKSEPGKILETKIQEIVVQKPKNPIGNIETINLLSDDEDDKNDVGEYFDTEFGRYKVPAMNRKLHESHQKIFSKKCIMKLQLLDDAEKTEEFIPPNFTATTKQVTVPDAMSTESKSGSEDQNMLETSKEIVVPIVTASKSIPISAMPIIKDTIEQTINPGVKTPEVVPESVATIGDTAKQIEKPDVMTPKSIPDPVVSGNTKQATISDDITLKSVPVHVLPNVKDVARKSIPASVNLVPTKEIVNINVETPKSVPTSVIPNVKETKKITNLDVITPKSLPIYVISNVEDTTKQVKNPEVIVPKSVPTSVLPNIVRNPDVIMSKLTPASASGTTKHIVNPDVKTLKSVPTSVTSLIRDITKQIGHPDMMTKPKSIPVSVVSGTEPIQLPEGITLKSLPASLPKNTPKQLINSSPKGISVSTLRSSEPEVIEIDDSSNDDLSLCGDENPPETPKTTITTEKSCEEKILEFKNLLLKDLGVQETDDDLIKPDNQNTFEETSVDFIIPDTRADVVEEFSEMIVPDSPITELIIPDILKSDESYSKNAHHGLNPCFVKLRNCDALVDRYNHYKLLKPCSIALVRCDENIPTAALNPELTIDDKEPISSPVNFNTENFDDDNMNMTPDTLSRSGSFSILNDYSLLDLPLSEEPRRNTSPVMEAFESIAALSNRLTEEFKEKYVEGACGADWLLCEYRPLSEEPRRNTSPVMEAFESIAALSNRLTEEFKEKYVEGACEADWLLCKYRPLSEEPRRNTSPVMEAFESIAALSNRPTEEFKEKCVEGACEADWFLCKYRIHLLNYSRNEDVYDDQETIINAIDVLESTAASSTNSNMSEVHAINAPSLVKILTKFFQDNRMLDNYNPMYKVIPSPQVSPTHNLKRKYLDKFQNVDKISKRSKITSPEESKIETVQVMTESLENTRNFEEIIVVENDTVLGKENAPDKIFIQVTEPTDTVLRKKNAPDENFIQVTELTDTVLWKESAPYENFIQVTEPTDSKVSSIEETGNSVSENHDNVVTLKQLNEDIIKDNSLTLKADEDHLEHSNDIILNKSNITKTEEETLNKKTNFSETIEIYENFIPVTEPTDNVLKIENAPDENFIQIIEPKDSTVSSIEKTRNSVSENHSNVVNPEQLNEDIMKNNNLTLKADKDHLEDSNDIILNELKEKINEKTNFSKTVEIGKKYIQVTEPTDTVLRKENAPDENFIQVIEPTDSKVSSIEETRNSVSEIQKNVLTPEQLNEDIIKNNNLTLKADEDHLEDSNYSILNEAEMTKTEELNEKTNFSETVEICESITSGIQIDEIITSTCATTTKHTTIKTSALASEPESENEDITITTVTSPKILQNEDTVESKASPEPQQQTTEVVITNSNLPEVLRESGYEKDKSIQTITEEPVQNFNIAPEIETVSSTADFKIVVDSSSNNTRDKSEHKLEARDENQDNIYIIKEAEIEISGTFNSIRDCNNAVDYSFIQEVDSTDKYIYVESSDDHIQVEENTLPGDELSRAEVGNDCNIECLMPNEPKTETKVIESETVNNTSDNVISSSDENKIEEPVFSSVSNEQRNEGDFDTNIDVFNNITSKLEEIFGPNNQDETGGEISELLEEQNKNVTSLGDSIDHEYTLNDASVAKEYSNDKIEKNEYNKSLEDIHMNTNIISKNHSNIENALIEDVVDMHSDELLEEELAQIVLGHGASGNNDENRETETAGNENSKNDLLEILGTGETTSTEEDFSEKEVLTEKVLEKSNVGEILREDNPKCDEDKIKDTDLITIGETCALLQDIPKSLVTDIVEIQNNDELELELARIVLGSAESADSEQQILIINTDNLGYDEVKVCCIQQSELKKIVDADNNSKLDKIDNETVKESLQDYVDYPQSSEDILQITQEIDEYGNVKDIEIKLNVPKTTYSRKYIRGSFNYQTFRGLKRKSDMTDARAPEKKYRKGKNIDTPKLTRAAILESTYAKEFNRLFDYCSSVKFSYSRPFHKEYIDVDKILRLWPSGEICDVETDTEINENLFSDSEIVPITVRDPLNQTLAEEIIAEYNESDYSPSSGTETNFQMGFGERSGRVIQNSEDDGGLKFSAATLSDVKQTQPLLLSENYDNCNSVPDVNIDATKQKIEALQRNYKCMQLKDKVRSFFKKTMVELSNDWINQNKKQEDIYLSGDSKADKSGFPFGLNLPEFINPPPVEVVIQVVQVGQLPVSAAAQNPVTCDPRVTQVSDVSPSQCSADNGAGDDPHSDIKTEYTELTTADISLPLQDYAQHHSQLSVESQNNSNIIIHHDFVIEEIKEEIKEEIEEEPEINDEVSDNFETVITNNEPSPSENNIDNNVEYTYETSPLPQPPTPTQVEANMEAMFSALETNQQSQITQQNQPEQFPQQNQKSPIVQLNQHAPNSHLKRKEKKKKGHNNQQKQQTHIVQQSFQTQLPQQNQQAKASSQNQQIQFVNQNQQPQTHIPQPNQQVLVTQQNQQVHIQQNQQQQGINSQQNQQQQAIHSQQNQQQQAIHSQQNQQAPVVQQNAQTHLPQQSPQGQLPHQNSQTQPQQNSQEKQNGSPEKTDQIAHAMNAAGITTSAENLANTRAHALVNILSQKLRQGSVGASSTNTYQKTTQINAMALQQALAQILPPPLNQTNVTENNQQTTTNTPQVLHIVQGKNASGNQITLVDNGQPSVISTPNATPVLHIVQNKANSSGPTANGTPAQQTNSFSGLSLVDAGLQQGNQLLHIVNAGNQKNTNASQLLRKVNLLTNLANVQGSNEQKMVQFVCKSADGKSIQLNSPHPRGMVLRLQPVETPSLQLTQPKPVDSQDLSQAPNTPNNVSGKETAASQQEIKSRSVYEENYAKFIQSSNKPTVPEKATSLPKFGQAFGKQVFQDGGQKNDINNSNSHLSSNSEAPDCQPNDNAINLDHISQISSPPLLLRKSPQTSQSQPNLVQQLKQTISPMNMSMHGGVIYTRQIPVNIGGGQTINLITVPSTDLIDDSTPKHQTVNQDGIEPSIIKIVPQTPASSAETSEENSSHLNVSNETTHTPQPQQVLTQMRIKLPMLSKTPQMVGGTRLVRPSFFQIQRNVIGGANQPVYQQLVLTAAPPLGQQTIRLPQAQTTRQIKVPSESQSSSESQMSSSTLEQLREFDLVLEQVKERSTGTGTSQPSATPSSSSTSFSKLHTPSTDTTDSPPSVSAAPAETTTQPVLYSIGNSQPLNVTYVNRKAPSTTTTTSSFARSPDSSGIVESPTSSTHQQIPHTVTSDNAASDPPTTNTNHTTHPSTTHTTHTTQPKPAKSKPKSRPKASSNPPNTLKLPTVPPKTSTQKPAEDEQTTQRILYILAEYKEQVENSPDKDKPAPRRRTHASSNPGGSSKRKKSSSGSRRSGRDMSPCHGEDTCRTMGSEDSSCGTSQGDCNESCIDSHSPQDSPRKVVRKLTYEQETPPPVTQPRPQPQRNVIVADGQTITVARGTAGKPTTAVLMPANYILPVSMVKGGQQIAIVTNRGPKLLTVGGGEGGASNALLLQRLIGPAGLKPVLARPGVRHVRLPTAALHNLHAFNLATATTIQPPDSTASPAPAPTPPDLVDTRASSSPWRTERESRNAKPERGSSPEGSEPWHLPPSEYSYEETVRSEHMDRTVLDPIPDRYSPDMEAQRIFDKMFDVDSKKSYMVDSHDDSPRCGYDIDASDCDDKAYHQVVHKKDGSSHRQHRLTHVSAAALRHKYAILEHELRLQKSLSEECEDLGVDSPSASELFPEAELLFAASPAHDHNTQDQGHHSHTPQPLLSHSSIPQPDLDDQIATDQLIQRSDHMHDDRDLGLGLEDVGIVTVSEDGMQATIQLDQEEFARSHPNTTFHSEPTDDGEVQQPFTLSSLKGRHITSTIFHSNRPQGTVLMTAPQTTVISQATAESSGTHHSAIKYSDIDNMINSLPSAHNNSMNLSSVLVKDDGLSRFDNLLNDSRELHLSNTASAIVHSSAHTTQVIRRVCYEDDKRERDNRFLMDEADGLIAGDDAKMMGEDSSREATLESVGGDTTGSSPERHTELFWDSHSASGRADFSSDSEKCCKSPSDDTSTDSSAHAHMRLDSVIKEARGLASDEDGPPLRTYPAPRSLSGKTAPSTAGARRRASGRGVVKRGTCLCCVGEPAPPRPKKPRQRRQPLDFAAAN